MKLNFIKKRFNAKIIAPVINYLKTGVSPPKIALAITLGIAFGTSPLYGITTILCALAAFIFRINMAVIQAVNYLLWPVQIALFLPFIRLGEKILKITPIPFSIKEIWQMFDQNWLSTLESLGNSWLSGIIVWLVIAIPLSLIIYLISLILIKRVESN